MELDLEQKQDLIDRSLNFNATMNRDFGMSSSSKKVKVPRDPMSHRIIEKRRRDRMNNCLADLSRLIPSGCMKQGHGRIEKTEIIEMAIQHINSITAALKSQGKNVDPEVLASVQQEKDNRFYHGFKQCMDEVMNFFSEKKGCNVADETIVQLIKHLQGKGGKLLLNGTQALPTAMNQEENGILTPPCSDAPKSGGGHSSSSNEGCHASSSSNAGDMLSMSSVMDMHSKEGLDLMDLMSQENMMQRIADERSSPLMSVGSGCSGYGSSSKVSSGGQPEEEEQQQPRHGCKRRHSGDFFPGREIYKFKSVIKTRFNADVSGRRRTKCPGSDSSSSSSQECSERCLPGTTTGSSAAAKQQCLHSDSMYSDSASTSTPYPVSECSSLERKSPDSKSQTEQEANALIPGFALHTSGTHYIPVRLYSTCITPMNKKDPSESSDVNSVYHPISIPVNFGGTYLGVKPCANAN